MRRQRRLHGLGLSFKTRPVLGVIRLTRGNCKPPREPLDEPSRGRQIEPPAELQHSRTGDDGKQAQRNADDHRGSSTADPLQHHGTKKKLRRSTASVPAKLHCRPRRAPLHPRRSFIAATGARRSDEAPLQPTRSSIAATGARRSDEAPLHPRPRSTAAAAELHCSWRGPLQPPGTLHCNAAGGGGSCDAAPVALQYNCGEASLQLRRAASDSVHCSPSRFIAAPSVKHVASGRRRSSTSMWRRTPICSSTSVATSRRTPICSSTSVAAPARSTPAGAARRDATYLLQRGAPAVRRGRRRRCSNGKTEEGDASGVGSESKVREAGRFGGGEKGTRLIWWRGEEEDRSKKKG